MYVCRDQCEMQGQDCPGVIDDGPTRKRRPCGPSTQDISPPPLKRKALPPSTTGAVSTAKLPEAGLPRCSPSPFHLTQIRDLPDELNHDTISLGDLLGDPLIKGCWLFNYLFDVDWLMAYFDVDVRNLVQVKIVHGSWRKDDANRIGIDDAVSRWPNVEPITAYMPEPFGTHHSKMMIMIRHDDAAQVVIHTANMISQDWTNLTQAAWSSPKLPLIVGNSENGNALGSIGSGERFKYDLMRYLRSYGEKRTGRLIGQLKSYDFSGIRATLVASAPCRISLKEGTQPETWFGWPYLRHVLRQVPPCQDADAPLIVSQVSSIGYSGEDWIRHFFDTLATSPVSESLPISHPKHKVMFPTVEEIRMSLDGYRAGASIHMRVQSSQAQRQLAFLMSHFVRWSNHGDRDVDTNAGRGAAAPHIKTYVRYANDRAEQIEWAMLTSANMSTQAWGSMPKGDSVRICSYEVGVLVWPALLSEEPSAVMVPTFRCNLPIRGKLPWLIDKPSIGFRMPYDLPLKSYAKQEHPWIATAEYKQPDCKGAILSSQKSP